MAQIEHGRGFKWLTELGGKSYFKSMREEDLGNLQPGDSFKI
jgi:hypothetical protein